MPVFDAQGNAVQGEMTDFQVNETSPCGYPINDRKFLVRRGMDITPEQVKALRSQGVAVDYEPGAEPVTDSAGLAESIKQSVMRGLQDLLKPFTQLLSTKGESDMDPTTQTQTERADEVTSVLTEADWEQIGKLIDDKITAALTTDDSSAEGAEGTTTATQGVPVTPPVAPPAPAAAAQATPSQLDQLTAVVAQMAKNQDSLSQSFQTLLNSVPGGQSQTSTTEAEAKKGGVWSTPSPFTAALAAVPKSA